VWLLVAFGIAALITGWAFRTQLRFAMKHAKGARDRQSTLQTVGSTMGHGVAVKVVPFPDFGVDEILLALSATLLLTVYRPTFLAILAETRAAKAGTTTDSPTP
jgi:hypothetical protein